jgi:flagellar motor switch protein FliN/FliY
MSEEALVRLGNSTGEAVDSVLRTFCGDAVERGGAVLLSPSMPPLEAVALPAVVTSVNYVDGVQGGNIFAMTRLGARRLAAAMMGEDPDLLEDDAELSELELSAVGEAMNQMMAVAAGAIGKVLGEEVEIAPPETMFISSAGEAASVAQTAPHVVSVAFVVLGEPCRLVQLVPNAFIVRMGRALAELEAETLSVTRGDAPAEGSCSPELLRKVPVTVWAELGRTRMPVARAVGLPRGAVVELDRAADEPVDVYVNGRRFARASLVVVDGSEWAIRIEELLPATTRTTPTGED